MTVTINKVEEKRRTRKDGRTNKMARILMKARAKKTQKTLKIK